MKERKQKILSLESEFKKLEITLDDANTLGKYNCIKNELKAIYDHIAEGIRIEANATGMSTAKSQQNFFQI